MLGAIQQFGDVRSKTFEVHVKATVNGYSRDFVGILGEILNAISRFSAFIDELSPQSLAISWASDPHRNIRLTPAASHFRLTQVNVMAENIPNIPSGAVPPKKETGKVQPKKETVRINLPPKPSAAPT